MEIRQLEYFAATADYQMYWAIWESFQKGELLGTVEDVWGNRLQVCFSENDGIVLYETVGLGVREGDSLIAYGELC